VIQGPFTTRHYPNLPSGQHAVQRLADEFNAAERKWEQTHPAQPKRKGHRKGRKTVKARMVNKSRPRQQAIGFAKP